VQAVRVDQRESEEDKKNGRVEQPHEVLRNIPLKWWGTIVARGSSAGALLVLMLLHEGGALVDLLAQGLAGLEVGHALLGNHHALARTRVASDARRAAIDRETAEAPDLDAVALHQGVAHGVEDRLDGELGISVG